MKSRLLVVDDTTTNRELVRMLLEDLYEVEEAQSGEECLEKIEQSVPDLVLLDVSMPGMDGYEVCARLRKQQSTQQLPIIFVSALVGSEERLKGFEVGADDYLTKPIDEQILKDKISFCLKRQKEICSAKGEAADAMRIAMEAMTVSSELGQIVQFVKNLQSHKTAEEVGAAIIGIASEFNLNSSALVITDEHHFVGCGPDSMEAKVLEHASHSTERLISVGIRTILRNDHMALLIRDMPQDDENRCGRLKDHLAVLMDIANSHLVVLASQSEIIDQRKNFLHQVISLSEGQIQKTSDKLHTYHENSQSIMEGMLRDMENMLFGLGLDEDQEKSLMELADNCSAQLRDVQACAKDMEKDLTIIVESLHEFLEQGH